MSTPDERTAFVAGLRDLASFVEAHEDLPVPSLTSVTIHPRGTVEEERAEVDRIAAILDAAPEVTAGGDHYVVARMFGPVEYQAIAITRERMERWRALMTYGDAVQPERTAS